MLSRVKLGAALAPLNRARTLLFSACVAAFCLIATVLAPLASADMTEGVAKEIAEKTETKLEAAAPYIVGLFVALFIFGAVILFMKRHGKSAVRT